MEKICTTIEQSKKLLELGIDINTSDMYWSLVNKNHPPIIGKYCAEYGGMQLPAWSLSALFDLLPEHTRVPSSLKQNKYMCNYHNGIVEFGDDCHKNKSTNLFDVVFEMVCWLKENNKI